MACIDCGTPGPGTRCPKHRREKRHVRDADRAIAKAVVRAEPWCHCHDVSHGHGPTCGATEDLTADHSDPLELGGTNDGERATFCRSCNSKKGPRRP